jgi:thiamine-monophosphate kinase
MKITESKIIDTYFKPLTFYNKNALMLEDDVYYDSRKKIIFSTDIYEENIHFLNPENPAKFVQKIFRSSISDIYCKGFKPTTFFLSLSMKKTNKKWLINFKNELIKESKKFNLFLGGGDTIKSRKLSIVISVLGSSNHKPILRKNAKLNEDIYVTGNLGDSYLGLLVNLNKINLGKLNSYFKKQYQKPNLPHKFSEHLYRFASSSIDISDGIYNDLQNICKASSCGAIVNFADLPFSKHANKIKSLKKISLINIFSKGDDYQILFTAKQKYRKLIKKISKKTLTKVTRVGIITSGKIVKLIDAGNILDVSSFKRGYIHKF